MIRPDSQIVRLKSAGADVFYDISTPKFAAQAIRKVVELNWKPIHILTVLALSLRARRENIGSTIASVEAMIQGAPKAA